MKNIIAALILAAGIILAVLFLGGRYVVTINEPGFLAVKYDKITGKTWVTTFKKPSWVKIQDYGHHYPDPLEVR